MIRPDKTIPASNEVRWRSEPRCRGSHEKRRMNWVLASVRRPTTKRLTNQRNDARDHEWRFGSEHVFRERCRVQGPTFVGHVFLWQNDGDHVVAANQL